MIARLLFLLALALVVPRAAAAPAAGAGHRFVFLVDASALMEPARKATEKAIEELIASGARGQMQAGDEFVIWPYRLKVVNDAFPPAAWTPTNAVALAKSSGDFLRNLKYDGAGLFYIALVETFRVIKASPAVTVFLVSDGAEMLQGTPFDLYANTIYRQRATQLRKEKKPFVTALLALDGNVIDCTVGVGGEPLTVPAVPPESRARATPPTPAPVTAPATATATPVVTKTSEPTPAAPKKTPAITTKSEPKTTATAPTALTPTTTSAPPKTAPPPPPAAAPTVAAPATQAPVVVAPPSAPSPTPAPVVATPPPATVTPEPAPPTTVPPPAPPPAAEPVAPSAPPTDGKGFQLATLAYENQLLVIGVGLLLVAAVMIGFILLRRPRKASARASLITRSMKH